MKHSTFYSRLWSLVLLLVFSQLPLWAQVTPSSTKSYVLEQVPRVPLTSLSNATPYSQVQTSISYVDGLGRPLQTVIVRGSADGQQDIVTNTAVYDNFGRQVKSFLPTPNSSTGGAYLPNPQALASAFYNDNAPFSSVNSFDNSPLNRPVEQYGVGQAWRTASKSVSVQYKVAPANSVIYFQAGLYGVGASSSNFAATNLATSKSYEFAGITATNGLSINPSLRYYNSHDLSMTITTNERGKKLTEYKDPQNRLIRKDVEVSADTILTTHYVYDIFERLAYVIPPETYLLFSNSKLSLSESETAFTEGMYAYRYDERGRLIRKHIPGMGWTSIVYDKLDRPVMTQDPQEAAQSPKQWQFTKYDALGRTIMAGITTSYNSSDRDVLQTAFNAITTPYEERGTAQLAYTKQSFPSSANPSDAEVMKVQYYDTYDWIPTGLGNQLSTDDDPAFSTTQMDGQLTGGKERNLSTNDWYASTLYYDYRLRLVNQNSDNHLGGKEHLNMYYNFVGEVLRVRKSHDTGTSASLITETSEYSYDHVGRKKNYIHGINGAKQQVATYQYDAIGRLIQKQLRPSNNLISQQSGNWTDASTWLGNLPTLSDFVTINTGHHVAIPSNTIVNAGSLLNKGTLDMATTSQLNLGILVPNGNATVLQSVDYTYHIRGGLKGINLDASGNVALSNGDLFAMKLGYEEDGTYYDGNIRKQEWKTSLDNLSRSFTYRYDGASRIKAGVYQGGKTGEDYSLKNVTYDNNGNIKNLVRNGLKTNNNFGIIDNLAYTYLANSNKIQAVTDNSNETASFTDAAGTTDYTYSSDGSLISDANKGISLIEYNYLKLPKRIVKGSTTILYQYSASGKKLKETIGTNVTDYVGNLIYRNSVVYQLANDEGRVVNGTYEYDIKDHLGSLRVSFKDSVGIAKTTQESHTGVWGEELPSLSYKNTPNLDNFKFTGKENLPETDYTDFGARLYDNLVPRFISIDPLAEISRRWSPYAYTYDNPLRFIDPDGMGVRNVYGINTYDGYVGDDGNGNYQGETGPVKGKNSSGDKKQAKNNDKGKQIDNESIRDLNPFALAKLGKAVPIKNSYSKEEISIVISTALSFGIEFVGAGELLIGWAGRLFSKSSSIAVEQVVSNGVRMSVESSEGIISGSFNYSNGQTVEFLANKTVNGNMLELTDMAFYPKGVSGNELKNVFGSKMMGQTLESFKQYAKEQGFSNLRIQFQRAANSSSANPGKVVDKIFNLK